MPIFFFWVIPFAAIMYIVCDFIQYLINGRRFNTPLKHVIPEQRLPGLHRPIRALYNKVGDFIHKYYGVFNSKWVADLVYVLMKPLEWFFVVVLYAADRKPENRIAQQYMDWDDRKKLKRLT